MKRLITALLGAAAMSALAASPALAFDKVDWDWKTKIDTHIDIDADIQLKVDITGMVQVEKLQIFLGDVNAESTVYCITNTPFYPVVPKDEHHGDKRYGDSNYGDHQDGGKSPTTYAIDNGRSGHHDFDKINVAPLDATTQLPIVLSSATAIGNNQSITSDVPVYLHDGQFVAEVSDHNREIWSPNSLEYAGVGDSQHGGNTNTELAALFTLGAVFHVLKEANIEAESTVYDIRNASVDSSATAVANNLNVTVASGNASNHIVIADITQFALANVSAESEVSDVSATGYSNMRQLKTDTLQTIGGTTNVPVSVPTPWVSSVATAIGNNASINVGPVLTNHH